MKSNIRIVIDVIIRTGYSNKRNDELKGLIRQRMDSASGDTVEGAELPLAEAIEKGEGCRIVGNAHLLKVPTTVFITTEE